MSNRYILKNQKIPENQKTEAWDLEHIYNFVHQAGRVTEDVRRQQQLMAWKYFYGINDEEKQKKNNVITQPYGFSLGIEYMHYPLIAQKVEQVVGEYLTREIPKTVYVINKRAKAKKQDDLFKMVCEDILRETNKEMEDALGFIPETENADMELPENVSEFIEQGDYKTESEETSNIILEQVMDVKNQKQKIKDLLVDVLIQDEAIGLIEVKDGHPFIARKNIFECIIDYDPEEELQKDPQYFIHDKFMSFNELSNTFDLTKEEELAIKAYGSTTISAGISPLGGYDGPYNQNDWFQKTSDVLRIRCTEMIWISKKQIRAKVSINNVTKKEIYKLIPEDYKPKPSETVKKIWIDYKRKILLAGPSVILERGEINERYGRVDDLKKDTIPVVAFRRNNFVGSNKLQSFASKLMQLQDFASETLFELRLAMRRNQGRVLVYDAAQIPKQFLKTGGYNNALNRVMHHAKKDQFLIINSQDKSTRHNFNQFASLDLSTKGMMQELFNMLALIEDLASKFIGVSEERGGQVGQYQSATGTERAVAQSTARTEIYVSPFDNFIEAIMEKVLQVAKYCYEENESAQYVFGDQKTKFFKVYPSFFQDDVGVSIGSNFLERKKKDVIDGAAQVALGNAQTPDLINQLIDVINAKTSTESKKILEKGLAALEAIRKENNQAMQEAEKAKQEGETQRLEMEHQVKRDGYEKDIKVAEIKEFGASQRKANDNALAAATSLANIESKAIESISKNN